MINLKSTAVKVFPSAFRGLADGTTQYNPEARLTTEFNVTNLTNRLSSKDSFVIDWTGSVAIFNIHGYYFEANLTELLAGEGAAWNDVYAYIRVLPFQSTDGGNTTYKAFTLVGADDVGATVPTTGRILDETVSSGESSVDTFMGLGLQGTQESSLDPGVYGLHLLHKDGETWSVSSIPTASKLKFKSTEIEDFTAGKSIYEELNTGKINNINVTKPETGATLTIAGGKTLRADQSITLTGDALRTLTINGADKTLAGAATNLTFAGNFSTSGAHTTTFITTDNTEITLPVTGTLATLNGLETLTQKTLTSPTLITPALGVATATSINGLTIDSKTTGFEISGGTGTQGTIRVTASNVYFDSDIVVQDDVNINSALTINATTSVTVPLIVGGDAGKTGIVKVSSAGEGSTEIIGPNNGVATLIAGTYTSSATTANSEEADAGTLVKRTSEGNISANGVSVSSVNTSYLNDVLLSTIFESNGATVKNATKATNTAFTNNSFHGPISISSSGGTSAPLLQVGRTYQIRISFEGNPYDSKWSLGLITIPGGLDESVFTMLSAGGHYLQFYHSTVEEYSSITCWAKGPDNTVSKTGCNLYYKLIS